MLVDFRYHVLEDHTHRYIISLAQKYDMQSHECDHQSCALDP